MREHDVHQLFSAAYQTGSIGCLRFLYGEEKKNRLSILCFPSRTHNSCNVRLIYSGFSHFVVQNPISDWKSKTTMPWSYHDFGEKHGLDHAMMTSWWPCFLTSFAACRFCESHQPRNIEKCVGHICMFGFNYFFEKCAFKRSRLQSKMKTSHPILR